MTSSSWTDLLDCFEAHLDDQHALLTAGTPERLVPFVPQPDPGPLPVELAARARGLAARAEALVTELDARLARTAAALRDLRQGTGPAAPLYVDSRC